MRKSGKGIGAEQGLVGIQQEEKGMYIYGCMGRPSSRHAQERWEKECECSLIVSDEQDE